MGSIFVSGGTSDSPDLQEIDGEKYLDRELDLPWFPDLSHSAMPLRRKEVSRERKQKWTFVNTQGGRFYKLVDMCADKLGTETTIQVFDKLGKETGVKESNALIKRCIEGARAAPDEVVGEKHMHQAFKVFKSMKEQGYQLEEETYGPFLEYFVDMGMTREFCFFCGVIKEDNSSSLSRLGYYEMMLWIKVNDEKKIQELCNCIESYDEGNKSILQGKSVHFPGYVLFLASFKLNFNCLDRLFAQT